MSDTAEVISVYPSVLVSVPVPSAWIACVDRRRRHVRCDTDVREGLVSLCGMRAGWVR